ISKHFESTGENVLGQVFCVDDVQDLPREGTRLLPACGQSLKDGPVGIRGIAPPSLEPFSDGFMTCLTYQYYGCHAPEGCCFQEGLALTLVAKRGIDDDAFPFEQYRLCTPQALGVSSLVPFGRVELFANLGRGSITGREPC